MNGNELGPINLGNPDEYTIRQLAETVQEMIDPAASVSYQPVPSDDPRKRKPDITRARTLLGWEPTVPLRKGLELTIKDFKKRQLAGDF